jgi:hypothetical protein
LKQYNLIFGSLVAIYTKESKNKKIFVFTNLTNNSDNSIQKDNQANNNSDNKDIESKSKERSYSFQKLGDPN